MSGAVVLDSGPLGLLAKRRGHSEEVSTCHEWLRRLTELGTTFYIPEIADYEVRRELLRMNHVAGVTRLDVLCHVATYMPITTEAIRLWGPPANLRGKNP